jgi:hypothetical protein
MYPPTRLAQSVYSEVVRYIRGSFLDVKEDGCGDDDGKYYLEMNTSM